MTHEHDSAGKSVTRDAVSGRYASSARVEETDGATTGRDTRFRPGHGLNRTHGVDAFKARGEASLPDAVRTELATFRAGIEADQGGASELSTIAAGYVRRLAEVEAIAQLLAADIHARGLFTPRWRIRSTFDAYLRTLGTWDRLAARLGLERRTKDVTLSDWMQSH